MKSGETQRVIEPCAEAIHGLIDALNEQDTLLGELVIRLNPVLVPDTDSVEGAVGVKRQPHSPLVEAMYEQADRVFTANLRLKALLGRLET